MIMKSLFIKSKYQMIKQSNNLIKLRSNKKNIEMGLQPIYLNETYILSIPCRSKIHSDVLKTSWTVPLLDLQNESFNQCCGSGFGRIPDPGLCTPNDRRYLKYY